MVGWLLLAIFLIVTLAFTSFETRDIKCVEINILYDGDQVISIDKNEVLKIVNSIDAKLLKKNLNQINAEAIEVAVEKHETIENAEVYKMVTKDSGNFKGILAVKIKHREPLVRVITSNGSYYLDKDGEKFPVSTKYTANVLVASGNISDKLVKDSLLSFIKYLEGNAFWKAQIEQIHVTEAGEITMIPLVGDHFINLGALVDYREKLTNLKTFYEQVLAQGNWNIYKSISLKYKHQVIGTKR